MIVNLTDGKMLTILFGGVGDLRPVRDLVLAAMFAALTAVGAWLTLSLPVLTTVPFTLQTLFVVLSGLLLGARYGFFSQLLYLGLGVAGIPVFSGFHAGPAWLLGPTGGYLLSYPLAAALTGAVAGRGEAGGPRLSLAAAFGVATIYALGVSRLWFFLSGKAGHAMPLMVAVGQGMLPFVLPDALKAAVAVVVTLRARPLLRPTARLSPAVPERDLQASRRTAQR